MTYNSKYVPTFVGLVFTSRSTQNIDLKARDLTFIKQNRLILKKIINKK